MAARISNDYARAKKGATDMSLNPLDNPGSVFEIEMLYPNPSSRRTKDGPRYFVRFEVDKAAHDEFMASREMNLRLLARCVVLPDTDEEEATVALASAPEKPKREVKPKGDHGAFWAKMVKSSAYDCRDLQAWLEVESREAVHEALRAAFGVESLTFVSPREAVAKFEMALLPGVAAIARRLGD